MAIPLLVCLLTSAVGLLPHMAAVAAREIPDGILVHIKNEATQFFLDTCGSVSCTVGTTYGVGMSVYKNRDGLSGSWKIQRVGEGSGPLKAGELVTLLNFYGNHNYLDTCDNTACGNGVVTNVRWNRDGQHTSQFYIGGNRGSGVVFSEGDLVSLEGYGGGLYIDNCGNVPSAQVGCSDSHDFNTQVSATRGPWRPSYGGWRLELASAVPRGSWRVVACNQGGGITFKVTESWTNEHSQTTEVTESVKTEFSATASAGMELPASVTATIAAEVSRSFSSTVASSHTKTHETTLPCEYYEDGEKFTVGCMYQFKAAFTSVVGSFTYDSNLVVCTRSDEVPKCPPFTILKNGSCEYHDSGRSVVV